MERSRRLVLALILAGGLTVLDPPALDLLRYPVALVASWPVRALAGFFGPPPRDAGSIEADAQAQQMLMERHFGDARLFRVFQVDAEARLIFVVGGWEQGLASGDRVVAGDLLVGFVDRVEARWARIRVLGHRDIHVSGIVDAPDDGQTDGAMKELLLSGTGTDAMMARQGSRIDPRLRGCEVYAPEGADAQAGRKIGLIEHDDRLDREVVRCAVDPEALDEVLILDRDAGGELLGGRASSALVLAEGGGGSEARSWLIGRGTTDGVRIGCWVSSGGRLIGQVVRVGPFSSRLLALGDIAPGIPALELSEQGPRALIWTVASASETVLVTRGRSRDATLPRGLILPPGGWPEPRPAVGEQVIIHVPDDSLALLRLGASR